jgi:hypothetical protein
MVHYLFIFNILLMRNNEQEVWQLKGIVAANLILPDFTLPLFKEVIEKTA